MGGLKTKEEFIKIRGLENSLLVDVSGSANKYLHNPDFPVVLSGALEGSRTKMDGNN